MSEYAALTHELIELLGEDAAQKLFAAYGGGELKVPVGANIYGRRKIAEISGHIGDHAARLLVDTYARETLQIPTGHRLRTLERYDRIREAVAKRRAEGMGPWAAAVATGREFGLGVRRVYAILGQTPAKRRQRGANGRLNDDGGA